MSDAPDYWALYRLLEGRIKSLEEWRFGYLKPADPNDSITVDKVTWDHLKKLVVVLKDSPMLHEQTIWDHTRFIISAVKRIEPGWNYK